MHQHHADASWLRLRGLASDSFAEHTVSHLPPRISPTAAAMAERWQYEIVWRGDPIKTMTSFGTLECRLCMREKITILNASWDSPERMLNKQREIYGACHHKAKFHALTKTF